MSEQTTQDLKGTVSFTRKLSDGNYGSSDFFIAVQFDIPDGNDGEAIVKAANAASVIAKSVVFEQLDIEHTLDSSGMVIEVARRAIPGSVIEPARQAVAAVPTGGAVTGGSSPFPSDTTDATQKAANKTWAKAEFAANPGAFYDNRPKKADGSYKATSPDVKHKESGVAIWFDK